MFFPLEIKEQSNSIWKPLPMLLIKPTLSRDEKETKVADIDP